jgi:uncharacterized membrane protein YedE/YeeE
MRFAAAGFFGIAMGFGLSRIGFSDYGEVHRMFTFQDFRLLLTFIGAVAAILLLTRIAFGGGGESRPIHKGTVFGGILFGAGWALTGACPSIAIVQLGEGKLPALLTLAGVFAGTALYPAVHRRLFRWDSGSCDS